MGGDDLQELADVDPRLQAGDPARARGIAGKGHDRTARISRCQGDGGVAGLHRGPQGVRREAAAEVAGAIGLPAVIASEAKQSSFGATSKLDCFVASLLAMTWDYFVPNSRLYDP